MAMVVAVQPTALWGASVRADLSSSLSNLSPFPLLRSLGIGKQWNFVKVGPLTVSPMGLGTWAWGNQLLWGYEESMDAELQQVFNLAVTKGINLFDTADSYGTGRLNGRSELLLGKFIREYPGKEQVAKNVNIATKFAAYPWRLTPSQIVSACKGSLKRLEMEQLALGQLHWSASNYAPFQEQALWDGLVAVYEQGLVKAVGVSNYGPKQLRRIHKYLDRKGVPLSSVQVQFSLLSKGTDQMEVKAVCDELGIQLIAYSPLGLGMLTDKYSPTNVPSGPRGLIFRQVLPGLGPLLETLRRIAKRRGKTVSQAIAEEAAWPYSWPTSPDFPKDAERGTLSGRLLVSDPFQPPYIWGGKYAFLGLATPGALGSWETESKGYQFWVQADANGHFCIRSIRAGVYDLYGWVPGVVGDYKFEKGPIHVQPGAVIEMGDITYTSPRDGPTAWEIGVPDRTANGFFVPDTNPKYVNKLFLNHPEKWRQYGLWERYTDLYPTQDLVYTVGQSDWRKDWFYAHLNRFQPDGSFTPATWEVRFELPEVSNTGSNPYKLRIATAAANGAAIQLSVNKVDFRKPVFDTMQYGRDNAIARHSIHGLHKLWTIEVDSRLLQVGWNSFFLRQRKATGPFTGVLYDYLRLEAPACKLSGAPALASA